MPSETGFLRNAFFNFTKLEDISFEGLVGLYPRLERVPESISGNLSKQFSDELTFYRLLLEDVRNNENVKIAGDKDPRLIEYMSGTAKILPEAKFIHLVRDPRDVLLSKKTAQWSKGKPGWYHIFANYVQLKMGESVGNNLSVERYLVVTYEEILNAPEAIISDICAFLQVDFEPAMLAFQEKAKELVSEEEKQWKKKTMGPLLKNNTGKWKGKLEPWEVALTERLCRQAFEIGGYQYSNAINGLPLGQKIIIKSSSFVLKGIGLPYILYRKFQQQIIVWWKR
jgi:hypothetical protein